MSMPCDELHAMWADAYLEWDEEELDRLDKELAEKCTHPRYLIDDGEGSEK